MNFPEPCLEGCFTLLNLMQDTRLQQPQVTGLICFCNSHRELCVQPTTWIPRGAIDPVMGGFKGDAVSWPHPEFLIMPQEQQPGTWVHTKVRIPFLPSPLCSKAQPLSYLSLPFSFPPSPAYYCWCPHSPVAEGSSCLLQPGCTRAGISPGHWQRQGCSPFLPAPSWCSPPAWEQAQGKGMCLPTTAAMVPGECSPSQPGWNGQEIPLSPGQCRH